MKTISTALKNHLKQGTTTLAEAWKVTRSDGNTYGWTAHDRDVTIDGVLYVASNGLRVSAAHSSDSLRVDTIDATAFLSVSTEQELLAGVWDSALVTHFWYNWADPPSVLEPETLIVRHGNLGEITRTEGQFTAQVRGLLQRLNVRVGRFYSPGCPWRHALWNGTTYISSVECGLDLTTYIVTGTVTAQGDPADRYMEDNTNSQDPGYFSAGLVTFTSGNNVGLTREVNEWVEPLFQFKRPFPYAIEIGDTYTAVKGDDKTFATCQAYANVENFGGFPHLPGFNKVYSNVVDL